MAAFVRRSEVNDAITGSCGGERNRQAQQACPQQNHRARLGCPRFLNGNASYE